MDTAREFFEGLEARAGESKRASGLNAKYLFDVDPAGKWVVDVQNGDVKVREGEEDVDTTVKASEETFMKIVNGKQNPATAFMTGKLKVRGDVTKAMKLQQLFPG